MLRRLASWSWWREDTDNDNPNLSQLKLFKLAYLIPFFAFIVFSCAIFIAEQLWTYNFCFRSACIFNTYEIFKVPVWLLALSLPLTGLVAAHHRSVQAATQIQITESKNTFENYIKHKELFYTHIKNIQERYEVVFSDIDLLYEKIFPHNSPMIFSIYSDGQDKSIKQEKNYFYGCKKEFNELNEYIYKTKSYKEWIKKLTGTTSQLLFIREYNGYQISMLAELNDVLFENNEIKKGDLEQLIKSISHIFKEMMTFCSSPYLAKRYQEEKLFEININELHSQMAKIESQH